MHGVVVAWVASRSYFFAEDYLFLQLFGQLPLDADLLTRSVFGHLLPGWILLQRTFGLLVGANWTVATVVMVASHVLGALALTRLLVALHGRRWWHPLVTLAFGCSLVMLNTALWWGATTSTQMACAACISAWGCAARYCRTRRVRHLLSLAVMFAVALSLWEKSMVTAAYLGLFVLVVGAGDETWRRRVGQALRLWPVWAVMAVECLAVLSVYLRGEYVDEAEVSPAPGAIGEYFWLSVTRGFSPATVGIGYPEPGFLGSPVAGVWVANLLLLALVVWTSARSRRARRAWLWFAVVFVLGHAFVAVGRVGIMGAETAALILRYQLDATYLFFIAAAVAVVGSTTRDRVGPRPTPAGRQVPRAAVAGAISVALLVGVGTWWSSLTGLVAASPGPDARAYVETFRDTYPAANRERAGLLDQPVPQDFVQPDLYPWNLGSAVWPLLLDDLDFTRDPGQALAVDRSGRVGPVVLDDVTSPQQGGCAQPGQQPVPVLEDASWLRGTDDPVLLVMEVTSETGGVVGLRTTGPTGEDDVLGTGEVFEVPAGRSALAVHVRDGDVDRATLSVPEGGPVCVSEVRLATTSVEPSD